MTVAVTDFPDSIRNQTCGLGRFVAERMTTLLSQHRQCRLIERRRLDMVLNELKFSMSELVDPDKARKLGQMLGVEGLVVGSVTDLGDTVDLDARIIDIQTNVSLPGASASIVEDEVVKRLISECGLAASNQLSGTAVAQPRVTEAGGTSAEGPRKPYPEMMVGDFATALQSCLMPGTTITCTLSVTNNGENQQFTINARGGPSGMPSRFVDQAGTDYRAELARLGSVQGHSAVWNTLIKGVPTSASLVFEDVSPEVAQMMALIIMCSESRGERKALTIRNVAVLK
jgi:TolB-like protein